MTRFIGLFLYLQPHPHYRFPQFNILSGPVRAPLDSENFKSHSIVADLKNFAAGRHHPLRFLLNYPT